MSRNTTDGEIKNRMDIGIVRDLLKEHNLKEAVSYCQAHGLNEHEFAKIGRDLESELNNTRFWAVVGEDPRGEKRLFKGSYNSPYHKIKNQQCAIEWAYDNETSAKRALKRFKAGNTEGLFNRVYSLELIEIDIAPFVLFSPILSTTIN